MGTPEQLADRLAAACLSADAVAAKDLMADALLRGRLEQVLSDVALKAAETGRVTALGLMLELGFPVGARVGSDGATLLHAAAYAGDLRTVELLLARGAEIGARDGCWGSMPLEWACIGSGEMPGDVARPDWTAVVQTLLQAGATTDEVTVSADQPKPPSPEVADLLRRYGVDEHSGRG